MLWWDAKDMSKRDVDGHTCKKFSVPVIAWNGKRSNTKHPSVALYVPFKVCSLF